MIAIHKNCKTVLLFISLFLLTQNFLIANITLPSFFGDNMVLQQKTDVAIWGWAKANSTVQLTSSWNKKKYTIKARSIGLNT